MKTLILIRHAKSSWNNPGVPDRLRPLNKRGKRDAPVMGERLAERGIEVDRVISSPATRALATAEAITGEIGFPWDEVIVDERLYHADKLEMLEVIQCLEHLYRKSGDRVWRSLAELTRSALAPTQERML